MRREKNINFYIEKLKNIDRKNANGKYVSSQ